MMQQRTLLGLVVAAGLVGVVALPEVGAGQDRPGADGVVFHFEDRRIDESSGLVDLGDHMVTVNDSGDSARVFVVDPDDGRTVGMTEFAADVRDVEALAPAGDDEVWVADIGDNAGKRPWISVYRIPVGPRQITVAEPETYYLNYPDERAYDAESLVVDAEGRLLVITKSFQGGVVFRAPAELDRAKANVLERVGAVRDYATDAAFTAAGDRLVVRSLGTATVYSFPALEVLAGFDLPSQRQGEGMSIGPGDRVRLSTEGAGTPIHEVTLPEAALSSGGSSASPVPSPDAAASPSSNATPSTGDRTDGEPGASSGPGASSSASASRLGTWLPWMVPGVVALGALAIAIVLRRQRT